MSRRLNIEGMDTRHRALPPEQAAFCRSAAAVSLSQHHVPPIQVVLSDLGVEATAALIWTTPDLRARQAWDPREAVEFGACACVIAGIEELRGLTAVRRAEQGSGADYFLGPPGAGIDDLEDCVRLEVGGVGGGDRRAVAKYLLEKKLQARNGKSSLPAVAGVMGFAARLLMLDNVAETA